LCFFFFSSRRRHTRFSRDWSSDVCSSDLDPERDGKLAAFLRGEGRVFVATSILERGVTVPDVDVIVLYADAERIFQEPALIQMRSEERRVGKECRARRAT